MRDFTLKRFPSPLRYPGGKGKISNYIKILLLENNLVGTEYYEVYAGGASVALSLLFEEYVSSVHINDFDVGVYSFWWSVLNETEAFCRKIERIPLTVAEWERQRVVYQDQSADRISRGFATFYLNRVNRSGIISGGLIGGREQKGTWGIDARFNRDALMNRVRKIGRYRNRITLTGEDGLSYLNTLKQQNLDLCFIFIDPPYFVKGRDLYTSFYEKHDHEAVAEVVKSLRGNWVVAYDAEPAIFGYYRGVNHIEYELSYSAGRKCLGREVMFLSTGLHPPNTSKVAKVTATEVSAFQRQCYGL